MVTLVNRAKMTTPTLGTGPLTLGQPVDAFQSFAAAGVVNGDVVRYVIEDGSAWEIGTGIYSSTGPTLTRSPLQSSAGGAAIALTGQATIFVAATTEDFEARLARAGGSMTGPLRLEWNGTHAPLSLPNTGTTNPGTLADGDLWHRSNTLYARLGGNTRTLIHNGNPTTLASDMPQAEAEAGSATTRRWVTALRLRQAILGWWNASADKEKLDGVAAGAQVNTVTSVADKTGAVTLAVNDLSDVTIAGAAFRDVLAYNGVGWVNLDADTAGLVSSSDSRLTNSREWTASTVSQAEAEAGTATTRRAFTAQRLRQAILGWWTTSADKTKLDGIEDGANVHRPPRFAGLRLSADGRDLLLTDAPEGNVSAEDFAWWGLKDGDVSLAISRNQLVMTTP